MRLVALSMVVLAACDCAGEGEPEQEESTEPLELRSYFPSAPGDRWRYESAGEKSTRAISFADDADASPRRVVMTGDDLMGARYHEVSEDGVVLVTPGGEPIGTLLDAPLEEGHEWSYLFGEVACEARYTSLGETAEVAGIHVERCIEVERTCTHPEGNPFPVETSEIHTELYCPGIGRVRENTRIDPPPMGSESAEREDALVFYRVLDSPAPTIPEHFDCDHFLLVETDVRAACGQAIARVTEENLEEGCRMTFGVPGRPLLTVTGQRYEEDATQADADVLENGTASLVGTEELASYGYLEGRHAIAVAAPPELCPTDQLNRLGPLLKSLVRR